MLSKCINPACFVPFRYLHEGRIFQVDSVARTTGPNVAPCHKTEFFWLCEKCARSMKVVLDHGVPVTRPLAPERPARVSRVSPG
jgi:hypothetical protein